jgi:hypothetical protein
MSRFQPPLNRIFHHSSKSQTCEGELDTSPSQSRSFPRASVLATLFSFVIVLTNLTRVDNIRAGTPKTTPWQIMQHSGGGESLGTTLLKNAEVSFGPTKTISSTRRVDAAAEPSYPPATAAAVLSRPSQLSAQISHLDVRDAVECYVVTRMVQLEDVASNAGRGNNAEGVHRMLVGRKAFAFTDARKDSSFASSVTNAPIVHQGRYG